MNAITGNMIRFTSADQVADDALKMCADVVNSQSYDEIEKAVRELSEGSGKMDFSASYEANGEHRICKIVVYVGFGDCEL